MNDDLREVYERLGKLYETGREENAGFWMSLSLSTAGLCVPIREAGSRSAYA